MTDSNSYDRTVDFDHQGDVSALASAVISAISDKPYVAPQSIRAVLVQHLVTASLQDGAFDADAVVDTLRDERIGTDQIVDTYIPCAARELGTMWIEDRIGFAKVTIGSARLQGLLSLLAPPWSLNPIASDDGLRTLMVLGSDDNHTLGPHVATAQLRRMGASVRLLFGPDRKTLLRIIDEDSYDLIMFSCSRTDALTMIADMVTRIKTKLDAPPPIALGGLVLDLTDRIKEKTGVDLVTSDVKVAFKLCDNNRLRSKPVAR